jgi:NAD+ synthase (glutamine-hydrolysing)
VLVNLSASPFHLRRAAEREQLVRQRARELGVAVVLCNRVGGQDELVFDGGSVAAAADGSIIARCMQFAEEVHVVDVAVTHDEVAASGPGEQTPIGGGLLPDEELWGALQLGLRDYVDTNGFGNVVIGISGGIDSALVATLAVDALGADRVHTVTLPSQITSDETLEDARSLACRLGTACDEIAIEPVMESYLHALDPVIVGSRKGLMEENLQARIRGTLLMALSNQCGWLVLTTGNKSETAVGYSTLYGDTAGGFAPIKDVAKTRVWELARWRNEQAARAGATLPIPPSTIDRPPTAELRRGQLDEDSLPPYHVLDEILALHVEQRASVDTIVDAGFDRETAVRVVSLVRTAEYKRRQSPPGIRVTPLAFGRERRMPITNSWRGDTPVALI